MNVTPSTTPSSTTSDQENIDFLTAQIHQLQHIEQTSSPVTPPLVRNHFKKSYLIIPTLVIALTLSVGLASTNQDIRQRAAEINAFPFLSSPTPTVTITPTPTITLTPSPTPTITLTPTATRIILEQCRSNNDCLGQTCVNNQCVDRSTVTPTLSPTPSVLAQPTPTVSL